MTAHSLEPKPAAGPAVIDVTDATFETEVMGRSDTVTVVVDLWAEWCGPCKSLGPILEKVVAETGGKAILAKVDVDSNPGLAQAFQAQSIPAVHVVKKRQVVDSFMGAKPEAEVRAFIAAHVEGDEPSEIDLLIAQGDEASLRAALDIEADHEGAVLALAALLTETGREDDALVLLERIPASADGRRLIALARSGADATGDIEAQLDELLEVVKGDEDARTKFVDLLDIMGPSDPRTADYRKKLTARLY